MNEIIKSLYSRKSVRAYEDRAIPQEMKNLILEAAMQAPSAGCQQLYTILDITDQKLKEALAESLGIGSCYIGDVMENYEEQRPLLQLPDYVFPAVMLVFGWSTGQQKQRSKPQRCELKHIVHENAYRSMDGEELREMLAHECKNQTYEEWCSAFCNRKYNSDFAKEMSRSVAEYLEQFD